jgi:energy-coupling factor transport system ATP-binding protein
MIAFADFTYRYAGAARPALDGINLRIQAGEFVVVAGPSGCGKSTLALAIGGYLHHQFEGEAQGDVRVDGVAVGQRSLYEVADRVGLVQQNPENQFCTLSVADEVAFGLENRRMDPAEIVARRDEALAIVGGEALLHRDLATLSGGEMQKVAIASMIAAHPQVLVFDEPTSNLDPSATRRIFDVLERIRHEAGITIVVIEHKLGYLARFNPRLILMDEGRIVDDDARIAPEAPPTPRTATHDAPPPGPVLMRAEHLSHNYGPRRVLDDVDVALRAGELVALMGDNGSGKTTFLRCLMGLLSPTAGRVSMLGREAGGRSDRPPVSALVEQVGYLFQNPDHQLLGDTVWHDATLLGRNLGRLEQVEPLAANLIADCGLEPYRDRHPFRLSYGEKRRLNLVAMAAHAPRVLLADEILIGQDRERADYLMGHLRRIADEGGCVVLALHDAAMALRYADRVLFFEAGRVIADGTPQEVLGSGATLAERDYDAYLVEVTA